MRSAQGMAEEKGDGGACIPDGGIGEREAVMFFAAEC